MSVHISVIVPNYNHAKYLDQRIQSILNQTYQDFELIILDDCSPDSGASVAVIEKYRDNPHVSHIEYNDQNSGSTFKQWDKGIHLANGDLIWIAESDDFCKPTFLERLVAEFCRSKKLTLAYSLSQSVDAEGTPTPYRRVHPWGTTRLTGHNYVIRYMTMGNHCANASACLFKKSVYQKINKQFTTYKAGGDMLFWIEIAEQGNVAIVNQQLNFFRQHTQKVTPDSLRKGITSKEFRKTFDYILSHFKMSNMRKYLAIQYYRYIIGKREYEAEDIRKEIYQLWNVEPLSTPEKIVIKILLVLRHRLGIVI